MYTPGHLRPAAGGRHRAPRAPRRSRRRMLHRARTPDEQTPQHRFATHACEPCLGQAALAGLRRGDRVLCVDGAPLVGGAGGGIARAVRGKDPNPSSSPDPNPSSSPDPNRNPTFNPSPNPSYSPDSNQVRGKASVTLTVERGGVAAHTGGGPRGDNQVTRLGVEADTPDGPLAAAADEEEDGGGVASYAVEVVEEEVAAATAALEVAEEAAEAAEAAAAAAEAEAEAEAAAAAEGGAAGSSRV
eukprot:scaffold61475_cov54-Phaeocystis_antarctica.AAC.1